MSSNSQMLTPHPKSRFKTINNPYLTLRERLRTHKVFTKDQYFYLNYHKFSIKSCFDVY